MNHTELIPVLIRLMGAFLVAFPAIGVWSSVRDLPWTLIAAGSLLFFVDALCAVLIYLGIFPETLPFLPRIPLLPAVLAGLAPLCWAVGFLIILIRRRRY